MLEPKKLALLRIAQILHKYSDEAHPLKQEDIAAYLSRDYGIEIERKAVGRNLSLLKEAGYDIISTRNGCYLEKREFEDAERGRLVQLFVRSEFVVRKSDLFSRFDRLVHEFDVQKQVVVLRFVPIVHRINIFNVAAEIGVGERRELFDELFGMVRRNVFGTQHAVDEEFELQITDRPLTPLRSVAGFENGIDYKNYSAALPYMYTDTPEQIELLADNSVVDQIVDWFGYDIQITPLSDSVRVSVKSSPTAMIYWALQFAEHVEILSPAYLREKVRTILQNAYKKLLVAKIN